MTNTKKLPLRKCIGCGEQKEKKQLIRVIRTPEGNIMLDETGRQNGRGAYMCRNSECLGKALKSKALERSLKCSMDAEIIEKLKECIS